MCSFPAWMGLLARERWQSSSPSSPNSLYVFEPSRGATGTQALLEALKSPRELLGVMGVIYGGYRDYGVIGVIGL